VVVITLAYPTTEHVLGWTIDPGEHGTMFTNDATGHGMIIGFQGVKPF
jgi:hypothetical protein